MPVFYVDASVIVKRYLSEPGTEVVSLLFASPLADDRFYTSILSVLEVTSAVYRIIGPRRSGEALIREALARFRSDVREQLRLWPLSDDVVAAALPVVEQHRLRSTDAIHLASAMAVAALIPSLPIVMVSSDRELVSASTSTGLAVLDPADSNAVDQLSQLRRPRP